MDSKSKEQSSHHEPGVEHLDHLDEISSESFHNCEPSADNSAPPGNERNTRTSSVVPIKSLVHLEDDHGAIIGGQSLERLEQGDESLQSKFGLICKVDEDFPLTLFRKTTGIEGDDIIILNYPPGDPEDPFNWSSSRKAFISLVMLAMTLFIGLGTTAYSSGIGNMVSDLGVSKELGQLGLFTFNFACALAPLFLAPFCEIVGRKIVYGGAFVLYAITFIGLSLGKNIATILVMRALQGMFGCVGTILVGGTFSDIYDSNQRAIPMAAFSYIAILGTVAAPIYAGFIDQQIGWRWLEGIQGLSNVPLMIIIVLFFQETRGGALIKKRSGIIRKITGDNRFRAESEAGRTDVKAMLNESCVKAIKMLITEPVVFVFGLWIAFAWGVTYLFLSVIPITFTEKRGWSEGVSGLPYISLCLGATIGFLANFIQVAKYDRDRQAGKATPESRLYTVLVGGLFLPIGLFIYSFTQYKGLHWIGPVIGLAPIMIGIFFVFESCYSYTSDCYGEHSSSAIAGQGLLRNTLGAVTPLFASQFFHNVGSQYAGLILALVGTLLSLTPFVLMKYGTTIRARSKLASMAQAQADRQNEINNEKN